MKNFRKNTTKALIIGAGFAGLSAACYLAKAGYHVTILEKNSWTGGRAQVFSSHGFTFDMGPSWYWMPELFDNFFQDFGRKRNAYYQLKRLDPSYRVYFEDDLIDIPTAQKDLISLFEHYEPGAGKKLTKFLTETGRMHELSVKSFIPMQNNSLLRAIKPRIAVEFAELAIKYNGFANVASYYRKYFSHPKLLKLLEFPIFFLGGSAREIPKIYALLNYVDMIGGTWYPQGGFGTVVQALTKLAQELGVTIKTNEEVVHINTHQGKTSGIRTKNGKTHSADIVVINADYAHAETTLLKPQDRSYSTKYWQTRKVAPSSFLLYLGLNKKVKKLLHHTLFFHHDWDTHYEALFRKPTWPKTPLYYISAPSKTDRTVAPSGGETIIMLVPLAAGLQDTSEHHTRLSNWLISDLEEQLQEKIRDTIVVKKTYALNGFSRDYYAYKGNAFGLAHSGLQTAIFRPALRSKKIGNLFFTGHWTVPGIGVPLTLVSGKVVTQEIVRIYGRR